MLKPGSEIGNYVVTAAVASGGMGVVYRGRHRYLGQDAAIKVLLPNLAMKDKVRDRFAQEAWVQSQLQAPGIVGIRDFIVADTVLAIVMEFVDGPSLEHVLAVERPGPWAVDDALRVLGPVVAAVAYAHRRNVVHRDLKPANVLLDRAGGAPWPGIPKVTDFGLAKLMGEAGGMTVVGTRMGTIPYMAPEQYAGAREITARADVYALGMLLWRMLAGQLPYDADDFIQATRIYSGEQPLPPLPGDLPPRIREALAAALSVGAEGRPLDAFEFGRALGIELSLPASSGAGSLVPEDAPVPAGTPSAADTDESPSAWGLSAGLMDPLEGATPPMESLAPADLASRPSAAPPAARPLPWRGIIAGSAVLLLLLGGVALAISTASRARRQQVSADLVSRTMDRLAYYKLDHTANRNSSILDEALDLAVQARDLWASPEARGVHALATVWVHAWHLSNTKWNDLRFREDDALTREALDTPEGLLARALLLSNACTMMDPGEGRKAGTCSEATRAYDAARAALASDERIWLRFEATWTEAVFSQRLSAEAMEAGDLGEARRHWLRTMEICTNGERELSAAPVNDAELAEECLYAAGYLGRYEDYFRWARFLRTNDEREKGELQFRTLSRIYTAAHADCTSLDLSTRNRWRKKFPAPKSEIERFCAASGLAALGCVSEARGFFPYRSEGLWETMSSAYSPAPAACYLQ